MLFCFDNIPDALEVTSEHLPLMLKELTMEATAKSGSFQSFPAVVVNFADWTGLSRNRETRFSQ